MVCHMAQCGECQTVRKCPDNLTHGKTGTNKMGCIRLDREHVSQQNLFKNWSQATVHTHANTIKDVEFKLFTQDILNNTVHFDSG